MAQQLEPAPTHIPMVDPKTGMVNYVWANWFNNNRERTIYRGGLLQKTSDQTITTGFLQTLVTFDEVGYDTQGIADVDNNQLIVPTDARRVQVAASIAWDEFDSVAAPNSMRCVFVEVLDKLGNSNLDDNTAGDAATNAAVLRLQNIPGIIGSRQHFQEPLVVTVQPMCMSFTSGIMDVEPGDRFKLRTNVSQATSGSADIVTNAVATANVGANRCTWFSMVVLG